MAKALGKAIKVFVYELAVLGVLYYALVLFGVINKDTNFGIIFTILIILFFRQWIYFFQKQKSR